VAIAAACDKLATSAAPDDASGCPNDSEERPQATSLIKLSMPCNGFGITPPGQIGFVLSKSASPGDSLISDARKTSSAAHTGQGRTTGAEAT